ncbi:MAG TPA: hypothetical protein VMY34_11415 [Acidimicrobiales bacterium]|nr:hypothetical protein [Acidimicrobiales bacterium]
MSEHLERLLERDSTLWPPGNVSANRLGWLDLPTSMPAHLADIRSWAEAVTTSTTVLIGMGGSSLGPEVLRAAMGSQRLVVLDTTDPFTIAEVDPSDATFLVSSKSGGTLEVQTLLAHFWDRVPDGSRFAAITDPGTSLAALAEERGFSRTFLNPPDIGGRYSVLSLFGLVPAAVLGYDIAQLLERAGHVDLEEAVELGITMGAAARAGRDKLTLVVPPTLPELGLWLEQLIAESTGKQGVGCIPVPTTDVEEGFDRNLVRVHIGDSHDLGAEMLRWEVATAIAGNVLGIDPFDEPNVAESKANTMRVLDNLPLPDPPGADPTDLFPLLAQEVEDGDYISLQAYLPYGSETALEAVRRQVRDRFDGIAVTAGYGPRFLHSTGQLHKGGPPKLVAVQLVPRTPSAELAIPGFPYDFGTLIAAQAEGDLQSLRAHGRRVIRIACDDPEELA